MKISRERVRWYRASSRRDLGEFVGRLVVASGDVDELEAMELVLESTDFLAVRLHFRVMAARGFHHLVDDELGVASNVEASNSKLSGNLQTVDKGLYSATLLDAAKCILMTYLI